MRKGLSFVDDDVLWLISSYWWDRLVFRKQLNSSEQHCLISLVAGHRLEGSLRDFELAYGRHDELYRRLLVHLFERE